MTLYTPAKFIDTILAVDPVAYPTLRHDVCLALVVLFACATYKLRIGHLTPPPLNLHVL